MSKDELIAEFIGLKRTNIPGVWGTIENDKIISEDIPLGVPFTEDLFFNRSWDWLIPVIEKIESLGCIVEIWLSLGRGCKIMKPTNDPVSIANTESNSLIKAVYDVVIEFINWYNLQEK